MIPRERTESFKYISTYEFLPTNIFFQHQVSRREGEKKECRFWNGFKRKGEPRPRGRRRRPADEKFCAQLNRIFPRGYEARPEALNLAICLLLKRILRGSVVKPFAGRQIERIPCKGPRPFPPPTRTGESNPSISSFQTFSPSLLSRRRDRQFSTIPY